MDPFVESRRIWSDFHHGLADEIRAALNARIQPAYYATAVTYVAYDVIEVAQTQPRAISPDVGVWHTGLASPVGGAAVTIDAPAAEGVALVETPVRLANVEVREAGTDTLVTAIEILSPINKRPGSQRQKYLRKRRELLRSEVNVMELDLLRGGERTPVGMSPPPAPYYANLARAERRPIIEIWPIQLASRLPVLPVPLNAPDPDVPLELSAIVQAIYERGGYATRINYHEAVPPPPLTPEEQAWADDLLATFRG
jgi:hypothetical protein